MPGQSVVVLLILDDVRLEPHSARVIGRILAEGRLATGQRQVRPRVELGGVSVFRYDEAGHFRDRIEAKSAVLEAGFWRLDAARIHASGTLPTEPDTHRLKTTLTPEQVRESFATPETVPFWQLSSYIQLAENAQALREQPLCGDVVAQLVSDVAQLAERTGNRR